MRSSHGMVSIAPILAIAGLVGLGATGYRVISGACPFTCCGTADSTTTPVSDSACPACCGGGESETTVVNKPEAAAPETSETGERKAAEPAAPSGL
jgi:hypothetical protein